MSSVSVPTSVYHIKSSNQMMVHFPDTYILNFKVMRFLNNTK